MKIWKSRLASVFAVLGIATGSLALGTARVEAVEPSPTPVVPNVWVGTTTGTDKACTGTDFATLTEALADAGTSAGSVIHICPGTYAEAELLVSDDDLTLVGEGVDPTEVHLSGSNTVPYGNDGHRVIDAGTNSLTLRNLTLERGYASSSAGGGIKTSGTVTADQVLFQNNGTAYGNGGAIVAASVHITDSLFYQNGIYPETGGFGGSIYLDGPGDSTITGSEFTFGGAEEGGGFVAVSATGGTLTVSGSTFTLGGTSGNGGAIYTLASDGFSAAPSLKVENSTFSALQAVTGSAIYAENNIALVYVTLVQNASTDATGFVVKSNGGSLHIVNSLFAGNTDATDTAGCTADSAPTFVTSLSDEDTCGTLTADIGAGLGEQTPGDGAKPSYIPLNRDSAAIDAGTCETYPPVDERGVVRGVGLGCDVGAYEYYNTLSLNTAAGEVHTLTVPTGVTKLYFTIVGGGGGGGAGVDADFVFEPGGGGGGGEVKTCEVTVTDTDVVTYFFGLGGSPGNDGGDSWVGVNYTVTGPVTAADPGIECFALGGKQGETPDTLTAAGGDSGNGNLGGDGECGEGCSAGGGGAGAGEDGYDAVYLIGGAGGAGATADPTATAFGDTDTRYGGGGGGGSVDCLAGSGGTGGGGDGVFGGSSCATAPARALVADGAANLGGGGGGGAGATAGGSGGSGGGEVRIPAAPPGGSSDGLHVCVDKLYVIYGAASYNPKVYYCEQIPECSAPAAPTTDTPVALDPECCPTLDSPTVAGSVSGSDPECCTAAGAPTTDGAVSGSDPECCPIAAPVSGSAGCPIAPETAPTDGYATLSGSTVLAEGLVSELPTLVADETLLPAPEPLHYEHGIPDGWRKVNPDKYPDTTPPTCTTEYEQGDGVADSPLPITCDGGDPGSFDGFNYEFVTEMYIHPAVLKVKPKHLRVAYGTAEPSPYEYTIKGFKLDEDSSVIDTLPTCDSDYTDTAEAGSRFDITCSGGVADNYEFKYEKSHIHVEKVRVPLTPAPRTVTYGDPAPGYSYSVAGLIGPDSGLAPVRLAGFVAPECSSTYVPGTSAGAVDINCVGASSTNYEFVPQKGSLTVLKAGLRVKPLAATVAYGTAKPVFALGFEGLATGDTGPGAGYQAPVCSAPGYTASTPAGTVLTVTCTGGTAANYVLDTTATSTLTVQKAKLTVTPVARLVAYGDPVPVLSYNVSGFVNGESLLGGIAGFTAPSCGSAYSPTTASGSVLLVSCSDGSASNYTVEIAGTSTLTVGKAKLTVTPNAASMTYGSSVPALGATVTGFVNSENSSVLSAQPVCSSTYVAGGNAGSYAISCTAGTASNYTVDTTAKGTLTVNKATLRTTPATASVTYGSSAPSVSSTVTGFVNGQTASTAGGFQAPKCAAPGYSASSDVGSYTITCTGGSATNYVFDTTATSALTVNKAVATVTAAARTVTYGSAAPAYTFTLSNLKNSQTAATVAGLVAPTCSSTYAPTTNVGVTPAITCAGGSATNYTFTFVASKITVAKATLTVTPNTLTITKGSAIPAYTYTVAGFQNGQTAATAGSYIAPKCTSSYSTRSSIGTYTISCTGGSAANYAFSYKTALLTVK